MNQENYLEVSGSGLTGLPGDRNTFDHSMLLPLEVNNSLRKNHGHVLSSIHLDQTLHEVADLVPGIVIEFQSRGNMLNGHNHTVTGQKLLVQRQTQVGARAHRNHGHLRSSLAVVLVTHVAFVERILGLAVVVDSRTLDLRIVLLDRPRDPVSIVIQIIIVLLYI